MAKPLAKSKRTQIQILLLHEPKNAIIARNDASTVLVLPCADTVLSLSLSLSLSLVSKESHLLGSAHQKCVNIDAHGNCDRAGSTERVYRLHQTTDNPPFVTGDARLPYRRILAGYFLSRRPRQGGIKPALEHACGSLFRKLLVELHFGALAPLQHDGHSRNDAGDYRRHGAVRNSKGPPWAS